MTPTPPKIQTQQLNLHLWWFTALVMSINIALFLWQIMTGVDASQPTNFAALTWGADYAPLTFLEQPWRLFSSMFFHFGFIHLMLNMWALYIFGSVAEQLLGRGYYVGLYILAGLSGSLLSGYLDIQNSFQLLSATTFDPNLLPRVSAGASGAVMGLGGALTVLALLPALPQQRFLLNKKSLVIVMLLNLSIGLMSSGINNAAHIGGMLMGAVIALVWYVAEKFRLPWLKPLALILLAMTCYIFYQYCLYLIQAFAPFWQEVLSSMQQQLHT